MITTVAPAVHPDEKAFLLVERNLPFDRIGVRRIQILYVNRGDRLAEWRKDLGPASDFQNEGVRIPSFWEHTVGELWDIAERHRYRDNDYWARFAAEQQAESTLITDFLNHKEESWKLIDNQSVFGPGVSKQRNGFSKRTAYERAKERKHGATA